jgi:hypothetical protein
MLDREIWSSIVKMALANQVESRTPAAIIARTQIKSTRAPQKNLMVYENMTKGGQASRGRSLKKAIASRLCSICTTKCTLHCLQCGKLAADHLTPWIPCQLCQLRWSPSCPQIAAPRLKDTITPALPDEAFLCDKCYVICRLYPMPPEERLRFCR